MKNWKVIESGFIEVNLTNTMVQAALKRNNDFFDRYGNAGTHRRNKERQRMTGYLAEEGIRDVFPYLEYNNTPEVDFMCGGITFDAKSQGCNTEPKLNFSATLYEEQVARDVDFYIFCRTKNDYMKVWICGLIGKSDFLKKANYLADGDMTANFEVEGPRFEVEYRELILPQKWTESYRKSV